MTPNDLTPEKRKIKITNDLPGGWPRGEDAGSLLAEPTLLDFACTKSVGYSPSLFLHTLTGSCVNVIPVISFVYQSYTLTNSTTLNPFPASESFDS